MSDNHRSARHEREKDHAPFEGPAPSAPDGFHRLRFVLVSGRGAASGRREYQEFGGSIARQKPFFLERGLDLGGYFNGTLNADISPKRFSIHHPFLTLRDIKWHPSMPAEHFSFAKALIEIGETSVQGLVYYPHPETKIAYVDPVPDTLIELLAPPIEGALDGKCYGQNGTLWLDPKEIGLSQ
ncbi:hypothetical protein [Thioalkalivibrio sp. HK1]|uniref:hypothetical protein n=1 Tax=Thioalkalivibrio sp. HK1 TaxID=1469245 RepID=UPI0012DFBBBA|nr:hypothetical protein [Thioalkalivibrio sp. HK1]